jgi:Transposase DDE domain
MNGLTNYITERAWTDTVTPWFVLVDDAYQRLITKRGQPLRRSGLAPVFTDREVITVSLIIETFFQGHEEVGYAFVRQYMTDLFPRLLDLDRFNQRRRELIAVIEAIRCDFRDQKLDRSDPVRLVDSAPVTLLTYARGARCVSVVGHEYFGVVTSKKAKVFGLRLHTTVTTEQLIDEWLLAPAAFTDGQVLEALVQAQSDLVLVGDKGYTDADLETRLWQTRRILLLPLRRINQKQQWTKEIRHILGRIRHRVETVFSVASTVFNLERPRGRSLPGHVVRVATIILAHTLSFFM